MPMSEAEFYTPFHPSTDAIYQPCAFVGRLEAYQYMSQQLAEQNTPNAVTFIGHHHMGKSALLYYFNDVFDDNLFGIYFPIAALQPNQRNETDILNGLISAIFDVLAQHNFNLTGLPPQAPTENGVTLRSHLQHKLFPAITRLIRQHRRIIFLLDDLHLLIDAGVAADFFTYLSMLNAQEKQLGIVATVHEAHDDTLQTLAPLVDDTQIFRLTPLDADESRLLFALDDFTISDESLLTAIHQASGGYPLLLQHIGYHLYATNDRSHSQLQMINAKILPTVAPIFHSYWKDLPLNERLVLMAVSNLLYQDPLTPAQPHHIEKWLVETDYPLDNTTVRSALRSLEYQHLIVHQSQGVEICGGILQTWLLQNAQPENLSITDKTKSPNRIVQGIIFVLLVAVLVVTMLWATQRPSQEVTPPDTQPTVTLETLND